MLVSVLIPTRGRPKGLTATIESIIKSATCPKEEYEFLIRTDLDDASMKGWSVKWNDTHDVKVHELCASRLNGYESLNDLYHDIAKLAKGKWCWFMNDDAVIKGDWYRDLLNAPYPSFINARNYGLNQSMYHECPDCGFQIVPNKVWDNLTVRIPGSKKNEHLLDNPPSMDKLPYPLDTGWYIELVKKRGWIEHYLPSVTAQHNRHTDRTLTEERY
jgi:hypothetical protein